jgi:hypothetical protein
MVERKILWRLINGAPGAIVRQLGLADSRMTQIGRAIRWIRDYYAGTIRIEELADIAGMSLTSFHRHFLGVTSLSPSSFRNRYACRKPAPGSCCRLRTSPLSALPWSMTARRNSAESIGGCLVRRPARTGNRSDEPS